MNKFIVVGIMTSLMFSTGYAQQQRCNPQPQPRSCYQPQPRQCQPSYQYCQPRPQQYYSSRSYVGCRDRGGLSLSIGLGGAYVGYRSGYSQPYYVPQYQQPVYVMQPQYQQPVYVAPAPQYQQPVYVAPQVEYQQPVYVQPQQAPVQYQQPVCVQQQSPVYIAPAPQVGGLLPQMPAQQPVPQQPVIDPTPITRTTTSYYSSGGSVTIERFR